MITVKGGHCGLKEDIPDAELRGPGGVFHIGYSPDLLACTVPCSCETGISLSLDSSLRIARSVHKPNL